MNIRIALILVLLGVAGLILYALLDAPTDEPKDPIAVTHEQAPPATNPAPAPHAAPPSAVPTPTETTTDTKGATVYGVITDAITGDPIPQATIRAMWEEVTTQSDNNGTYRLAMEDINDELVVEAQGYAREVITIDGTTGGRADAQLYAGGSITGTVTDKDTGKGIQGVTIVAMPMNSDAMELALASSLSANSFSMDTDESGEFSIPSLPEGNFMVAVQVNDTAYLYEGTQTISIEVKSGDATNASFELLRGAEIRGRVLNPQGDPIEGAEVRLGTTERFTSFTQTEMSLDPNFMNDRATHTNAEGEYVLVGASPGDALSLYANAEGFAETKSDSFVVPLEGHATAPDITLHTGQTISGKAQYDDGSELENARVYLSAVSATDSWYSDGAEVDEDGNFALADVPVGWYELELFFFERFNLPDEEREPLTVEVKPGEDLTGIILTAKRPAASETTITGVVLNAQGTPVEGAQITAKTMVDFAEEDWNETDTEGRFTVDTQGLSARVEAKHQGKMAFADDVVAGADIRLVLGDASSISGVVVDATGNPCPRCTITLDTITADDAESPMENMFAAMGGMFGNQGGSKTNAEGYFRFGELTPGTYRVIAAGQKEGHGESQEITLLPGEQKSGIRITLKPGAGVAGRVRDNAGLPVKGASVTLTTADAEGFENMMSAMMPMGMTSGPRAITDEDGRFDIANVAPGAYTAVATHPQFTKSMSEAFDLDSGEREDNLDITLTEGGKIRGTLARNGEVKPHTMINLIGSQGMFNVMTDAEGNFEIDHVPPGRYMAQHVDMTAMMSGDMSAMSQVPTIVEVADDETTELDFSPPEGSVTFAGVVHGASGLTTISLRHEDAPDMTQFDPMNMDITAAIDMAMYQAGQAMARPDGTFSLDGVPPGNYIADITSMNFDLAGGIAAFENFDPASIPTYSVPITVTEEGAHFEFDLNTLQPTNTEAPTPNESTTPEP